MQYKYIVAAFLRGLSYNNNSGKCVTTWMAKEYEQSHHAREVALHHADIPDDIALDAEHDPADEQHIDQLLPAIRHGYAAVQAERQSTTAIQIGDVVYLIHPAPTVRYAYPQVMQDKIVFIPARHRGLARASPTHWCNAARLSILPIST